jgi:NTE family protein
MRYSPAAVMAGWAPRGMISTEPLKDTVRRVVPSGWAEHPDLWIMACDYASGRRVAFGRADAPPAELCDAVAASCAIPGFYRPVDIGGRSYVDGGMYSLSNLDVLRDCALDLVICMNPCSSLAPPEALGWSHRITAGMRNVAGRRLGREAHRLRERGTRVVLLQPTAEDLGVMGANLMDGRRRHRVIELAIDTVARQLDEPGTAEALAGLPAGDPYAVARPEAPPEDWNRLRTAALKRRRKRWAASSGAARDGRAHRRAS